MGISKLFQINEQSGKVDVNKTAIINKGSKYEFYADAFMQVSTAQRALKSRTTIRVNIIKENQDIPKIKITNLVDAKQLYPTIECITFSKNDFNLIGQLKKDKNHSSIALAQVQIETSTSNDDADYFLNDYNLVIESIKPNYLNKSSIDIKIKHLIDNIYVVYLIITDKSVQYNQLFLTDLYQIKLALIHGNIKIRNNIYLCVNINNEDATASAQDLFEKHSLIQFSQNIYTLYSKTSNYIDLNVYDLAADEAEFHENNLTFFIDSKNNQFQTHSTTIESNSSLTKLRLNITNFTNSFINGNEKLQCYWHGHFIRTWYAKVKMNSWRFGIIKCILA
jgi:hypothetical protein